MSTFTPLAAIGLLAVIDVTAALGQTAPAPAPAPAVPQNSASVATNAAPLPPGLPRASSSPLPGSLEAPS